MKVTFMKVDNVLFVGQTEEGKPSRLINPKMVFSNADGEVSMSSCIGDPKEIFFPTAPTFMYISDDEGFDAFYKQHLPEESGIIIPKNNLSIIK